MAETTQVANQEPQTFSVALKVKFSSRSTPERF